MVNFKISVASKYSNSLAYNTTTVGLMEERYLKFLWLKN